MTAMSASIASVDKAAPKASVMKITVKAVDIPADHRKHHPHAIQAMAENIDLHGLQTPIEVVRQSDDSRRYRLIFGSLRLQAVGMLDWVMIDALVKEPDQFASEASFRLRSISENMLRSPLSALDRSVAIADWCAIYRAAQPPLKPGPKPVRMTAEELGLNFRPNSFDPELLQVSEQFTASFSQAAQAFLNISRAGVFRALKVASIPSLQRERIALHWLAEKEGQLYALSGVTSPDRQASVIDLLIADKASTVDEALALLDRRPKGITPSKWEKASNDFGYWAEGERDRFYELQEADIARWQATRRGRR